MLGFPTIPSDSRFRRRVCRVSNRWALLLATCALALPLSSHAAERPTPMSEEARAWLGKSCTPQGCLPPRASAGMPLGFAGAVLLAAVLAKRRARTEKR